MPSANIATKEVGQDELVWCKSIDTARAVSCSRYRRRRTSDGGIMRENLFISLERPGQNYRLATRMCSTINIKDILAL